GASGVFRTGDADTVRSARLIRPSASTHVTDIDQTSVALTVKRAPGGVRVTLPTNRNLVQPGWYMLFVTDNQGIPSKAQWIKVP
ncbi:DUF1929 domain-containing protein, partial [Streptomyces beijiangensis]